MHLFARYSYGSRDAGGILDGYAVPVSTLVFVRRLRGERSGLLFPRPLPSFRTAQDASHEVIGGSSFVRLRNVAGAHAAAAVLSDGAFAFLPLRT